MRDTKLNPRSDDAGGKLPDPLGHVLRDPVDEKSVPRMWRHIEDRRARQHMPVSVVLGWTLLGAAVATLLLFAANLVWDRALAMHAAPSAPVTSGPLLLEGGSPIVALEVAPAATAVSVTLSDGSQVFVDPDTRLEPLLSSGTDVVLRLVRGHATFHVTPGGPRRWVIEAGLASVEVVGTRFSVFRRVAGNTLATFSVRVEVEHGVVLVRGQRVPDGVARLEAGASLDVSMPPDPAPATSAASIGTALMSPHRRAQGSALEGSAAVWRDAAAHGKYGDAYVALGSDGVARETERAASADDLFALADVARLSGHPAEAVEPLERLGAVYPSSSRASLAAVTLGRIELALGHAAKAGAAFEHALALGVPAGLEEDVRARLVEAYVKTGSREAAQGAARDYERRFPAGRRTADIAHWLAR